MDNDIELAEFRDVTVYYGKVKALDKVNLSLHKGSTMIIGSNGSGKSTLIKTMLGFIRPRRGHIKVLGLDPHKDKAKLYSRIAYIGEKDGIPYNIRVGSHIYRVEKSNGERAWHIAELFGLTQHLDKRYSELSRGLQRRLALVESLSSPKDVIILDDPFLGLDLEGRGLLGRILSDIVKNKNRDVIIITHMIIPGFIPSHLVVLDSGKIIYSGHYNEAIIKRTIISC